MNAHAHAHALPPHTTTIDRQRLVEDNLALVRHLASRMARRAHPYLEVDELISIGTLALMRASQRFDSRRAVSFGSFAYLRVRGAMIEGLGQAGPHSRGKVRKRNGRQRADFLPVACAYDDERATTAHQGEVGEALAVAIDARRLGPLLPAALADLDPRERTLVERHYLGGESLLEISRDLGVSKSWASRIHSRALGRLRAALDRAVVPHAPVAQACR